MVYNFNLFLYLSAALITVHGSQRLAEIERNENNVVDDVLQSAGPQRHNGGRDLHILMLTIPFTGHYTPMLALGEELTHRGHNVTLCASADLKENNNKTKKHAEKAGVNYLSTLRPTMFQSDGLNNLTGLQLKMKIIVSCWRDEIYMLLSFWFDHLTPQGHTQWDFIIADNLLTPVAMCIHKHTSIPILILSTLIYNPFQPSKQWLVPSVIDGGYISMKQTSNRLKVFGIDMLSSSFLEYSLLPSRTMSRYCSGFSLEYLMADSSSYVPLIYTTVIGVEYPRTIPPMTHYVGPILTKSPDPLSEDLKRWLKDKPEKSVVYISMGSIFNITEEIGKAFINGVLQTKYSAIWALRQQEIVERLEVDPKRVYITKWAPQLRILQQKEISMAILHGGNNGIHEALYNAVPIIVMPLIHDQFGNAGRIVDQGLGLSLDFNMITAEAITNSINEIESGDYRRNVQRIRKLFIFAGGVEKAADLVEYYKDVGFDHLIPAYAKYEWSWVQYYNVDVYGLLAGILVTIIYCSLKCCQCVYRRCCWKERSSKEKKE